MRERKGRRDDASELSVPSPPPSPSSSTATKSPSWSSASLSPRPICSLMYFSGSTKPVQNVNLSSGSSTKTASELREESARLRQDRDEQRKREASVRTLQRVYRSSSSRRRVKQTWRDDVDQGRTSSGLHAVRKVVAGWEDGKQVSNLWWQAAASGSELERPMRDRGVLKS